MKAFFGYSATTQGITVRVNPRFLDEQSDPQSDHYVWSYHIRIENRCGHSVQLIARHWIIIDGDGDIEEVKGEGVVGEQPVIADGGSFDYVSGCPLPTSSGTMHGSYAMVGDRGMFEAVIPRFLLDSRHVRPTLDE